MPVLNLRSFSVNVIKADQKSSDKRMPDHMTIPKDKLQAVSHTCSYCLIHATDIWNIGSFW